LDRVPLWRGNHVSIKQLIEDFARYPYLPRLKNVSVLLDAIREGLALITWTQDSFAYADSFDEIEGRYRGLRTAQISALSGTDMPGLIVKPEAALRQMEAEQPTQGGTTIVDGPSIAGPGKGNFKTSTLPPGTMQPKRFHGTAMLDETRVGRDASRIADEVIAHLSSLIGAKVTVTLEIEAEIPTGAPDHVVRIVTENSRTLKFTSHGFEKE